MITHFTGNISTLAFCQPVSVSTDGGSTRGCAIVTVSDKCDAIVHLEGLIDVQKEKTRITGLVEKKRQQLVKLQEGMVVPNYMEKVPLAVQETNKEKEGELEAELQQLDAAFATLSTMDYILIIWDIRGRCCNRCVCNHYTSFEATLSSLFILNTYISLAELK